MGGLRLHSRVPRGGLRRLRQGHGPSGYAWGGLEPAQRQLGLDDWSAVASLRRAQPCGRARPALARHSRGTRGGLRHQRPGDGSSGHAWGGLGPAARSSLRPAQPVCPPAAPERRRRRRRRRRWSSWITAGTGSTSGSTSWSVGAAARAVARAERAACAASAASAAAGDTAVAGGGGGGRRGGGRNGGARCNAGGCRCGCRCRCRCFCA